MRTSERSFDNSMSIYVFRLNEWLTLDRIHSKITFIIELMSKQIIFKRSSDNAIFHHVLNRFPLSIVQVVYNKFYVQFFNDLLLFDDENCVFRTPSDFFYFCTWKNSSRAQRILFAIVEHRDQRCSKSLARFFGNLLGTLKQPWRRCTTGYERNYFWLQLMKINFLRYKTFNA